MLDDSDQALMGRLQAGDETAFEVLVHKYQGMVYALVRRYMGSRCTEDDDLAQQVFLRMWRGRQGYLPKAKVKTWLYSIAVNVCLNEIRRLRTAKHKSVRTLTAVFGDGADEAAPSFEDRAIPQPGDGLDVEALRRRVQAAVDALPDQQRLAIVLARWHGLGYAELAETMDTTIPAVKSLLTRAREALRVSLGDLLGDGPEGEGAAATSPAAGGSRARGPAGAFEANLEANT